ncbi:Conserved_hypothetical protein [Hexamita inflata]|uniref:Uncharacterized protein n=1 Tax=Hexamita inflata TaxID=28002 RepID=A0AA86PZT2_9EUKA|nr:Conserved hypothetical protein [Hexamita inflata]
MGAQCLNIDEFPFDESDIYRSVNKQSQPNSIQEEIIHEAPVQESLSVENEQDIMDDIEQLEREQQALEENEQIMDIDDPEAVNRRKEQYKLVQEYLLTCPFGKRVIFHTQNHIQDVALLEKKTLVLDDSKVITLNYKNKYFERLLWDPFEQVERLFARNNNLFILQQIQLANLRVLDLSENSLYDISVLTNLKNLQILNVANNYISDVDCLNVLQLIDLDVSHNFIMKFVNHPALRYVFIQHNRLQQFKCTSKQLKYINIAHNFLGEKRDISDEDGKEPQNSRSSLLHEDFRESNAKTEECENASPIEIGQFVEHENKETSNADQNETENHEEKDETKEITDEQNQTQNTAVQEEIPEIIKVNESKVQLALSKNLTSQEFNFHMLQDSDPELLDDSEDSTLFQCDNIFSDPQSNFQIDCEPEFINLSFNRIEINYLKTKILKYDGYKHEFIGCQSQKLIARWGNIHKIQSNTLTSIDITGNKCQEVVMSCKQLKNIDLQQSHVEHLLGVKENVTVKSHLRLQVRHEKYSDVKAKANPDKI